MTAQTKSEPGRKTALNHFARAAAAHFVHQTRVGNRLMMEGNSVEQTAAGLWGSDERTQVILKTASAPATSGTSGWASQLSGTTVSDLAVSISGARSAAAELIRRGLQLQFNRSGTINVPERLTQSGDAGGFFGEGNAISLRQLSLSTVSLVPFKYGVVLTASRELAEHTAPALESVLCGDAAGRCELVFGLCHHQQYGGIGWHATERHFERLDDIDADNWRRRRGIGKRR
jgi:hypothetical protein